MAYENHPINQIDRQMKEYIKHNPSVGLGVVIKNNSKYDLEYVGSGLTTGYIKNEKTVEGMFKCLSGKKIIEKDHAGGVMYWKKTPSFCKHYEIFICKVQKVTFRKHVLILFDFKFNYISIWPF